MLILFNKRGSTTLNKKKAFFTIFQRGCYKNFSTGKKIAIRISAQRKKLLYKFQQVLYNFQRGATHFSAGARKISASATKFSEGVL